jgi:hypothetical protein
MMETLIAEKPMARCVECQKIGESHFFFVDEKENSHCLSCWREKSQSRKRTDRMVVVEL